MGIGLLRQRKYDAAATFFMDSIRLRDPTKNRWVVFQNLEGLACIAYARGQSKRAAILFGAAKPIQESLQSKRDPDYQVEVDQYRDRTRTSLGEEAFVAAAVEGQVMTLERAVDYALTSAGLEGPTEQRPRSDRSDGDRLTVREREVVRLVARGLTNREIAATLVVSARTAEAHVQNILNKLGFNTRAQVAAWAVERGLKGDQKGEPGGA